MLFLLQYATLQSKLILLFWTAKTVFVAYHAQQSKNETTSIRYTSWTIEYNNYVHWQFQHSIKLLLIKFVEGSHKKYVFYNRGMFSVSLKADLTSCTYQWKHQLYYKRNLGWFCPPISPTNSRKERHLPTNRNEIPIAARGSVLCAWLFCSIYFGMYLSVRMMPVYCILNADANGAT